MIEWRKEVDGIGAHQGIYSPIFFCHFRLLRPGQQDVGYLIVENLGYGDSSSKPGTGKDICGLSESWAYANEHLCKDQKFGNYYYPLSLEGEWFNPYYEELYDSLNNGIWTVKQIYDFLTPEVTSYEAQKKELLKP